MRTYSPYEGATRTKTFFAWLPVTTTDGCSAWMETVTVQQEFVNGGEDGYYWVDRRFCDR